MNKLYRYEIEYKNEDGDTQIRLLELPVFLESEYFYYIGHPYQTSQMFGQKLRRVKKNAMSTYAYDTKEKAKEHFIRRTSNRIRWYHYWIQECEKGLELIKEQND